MFSGAVIQVFFDRSSTRLCWPKGLWHAKSLNAYNENKCGSVLALVGVEHFVQNICMKFAWLLCDWAVKQDLILMYLSAYWLLKITYFFTILAAFHKIKTGSAGMAHNKYIKGPILTLVGYFNSFIFTESTDNHTLQRNEGRELGFTLLLRVNRLWYDILFS